LLRKQQKTLGGYFFLPHPVHRGPIKTRHNKQMSVPAAHIKLSIWHRYEWASELS